MYNNRMLHDRTFLSIPMMGMKRGSSVRTVLVEMRELLEFFELAEAEGTDEKESAIKQQEGSVSAANQDDSKPTEK